MRHLVDKYISRLGDHLGKRKENEGFETGLFDLAVLHSLAGYISEIGSDRGENHRRAFCAVQNLYRHYDFPGAYVAVTVGEVMKRSSSQLGLMSAL